MISGGPILAWYSLAHVITGNKLLTQNTPPNILSQLSNILSHKQQQNVVHGMLSMVTAQFK